jgi:fatty acid desaturase
MGETRNTNAPRCKREVRAQLELARFESKNNYSNIFFIAADWLTVIAIALVAEWLRPELSPLGSIVVYVVAVILIGSRMRALGILTHQAAHRQLFRNRRANDWIGRLTTAWPLLVSLSDYREGHQHHHRALGAQDTDPKAMRYKRLGLVDAPTSPHEFLLRHGVKPLLGGYSLENLIGAIRSIGERAGRIISWGLVGLLLIVTGAGETVLLYWVVPFLTSYQVIRHWMEAAEHASLIEDDNEWLQTRSWTSNRFVQWLFAPHSDSFHILHHQFPGIPHYTYLAAHRVLMRDCWEYSSGHHCDGLLIPRRADAPSVLRDIVAPDALWEYKVPWIRRSGLRVSPQLGTQ